MKDGRLIQLSTAEEMITNPASPYVAAFTRHAPSDRIISARAIMVAPPPGFVGGAGVPASAKLRDVAARVLGSEQPVPVMDDSGVPIGVITREHMIATLYPSRQ
jgi:glycine betaine/proline transport system ATP-binding protein